MDESAARLVEFTLGMKSTDLDAQVLQQALFHRRDGEAQHASLDDEDGCKNGQRDAPADAAFPQVAGRSPDLLHHKAEDRVFLGESCAWFLVIVTRIHL